MAKNQFWRQIRTDDINSKQSTLSFKSRPKLDVENNRTECETSQELDDPQLPD